MGRGKVRAGAVPSGEKKAQQGLIKACDENE